MTEPASAHPRQLGQGEIRLGRIVTAADLRRVAGLRLGAAPTPH